MWRMPWVSSRRNLTFGQTANLCTLPKQRKTYMEDRWSPSGAFYEDEERMNSKEAERGGASFTMTENNINVSSE
jgi:hypothetical protein